MLRTQCSVNWIIAVCVASLSPPIFSLTCIMPLFLLAGPVSLSRSRLVIYCQISEYRYRCRYFWSISVSTILNCHFWTIWKRYFWTNSTWIVHDSPVWLGIQQLNLDSSHLFSVECSGFPLSVLDWLYFCFSLAVVLLHDVIPSPQSVYTKRSIVHLVQTLEITLILF